MPLPPLPRSGQCLTLKMQRRRPPSSRLLTWGVGVAVVFAVAGILAFLNILRTNAEAPTASAANAPAGAEASASTSVSGGPATPVSDAEVRAEYDKLPARRVPSQRHPGRHRKRSAGVDETHPAGRAFRGPCCKIFEGQGVRHVLPSLSGHSVVEGRDGSPSRCSHCRLAVPVHELSSHPDGRGASTSSFDDAKENIRARMEASRRISKLGGVHIH